MRICLIGDYTGNPDEGMKNVSRHFYDRLSIRHEVLKINIREVINRGISTIRSFRPQVVHYLHGPTVRSLLLMKWIAVCLQNRSGTVVSATRPYFSKYSKWVIPFLKPDMMLTQSMRNEVFFRSKGCAVRFIPNGVDCEQFSPVTEEKKKQFRIQLGLPQDKRVVLHVGHIKINRQLSVFKDIQSTPDTQVVIVSGTTEKMDSGLKEALLATGIDIRQDYFSDISIFYKASDWYVFPTDDLNQTTPSHYNQIGTIDLPLSILEAMACNLPVITKRFDALERLFEQSDGFFFASSEEEILSTLNQNTGELSVRNRERALLCGWEQVVEQVERIYSMVSEQKTTCVKLNR